MNLGLKLACVPLLLGVAMGQQSRLDGRGWNSLSNEARIEFVAGYIDCHAANGSKGETFTESWYAYTPRISRYYDQHPNMLSRPVTQVLYQVRSKQPPKQLKGGETWPEKHGFFDGLYWRQMGDAERGAFVDGYLSCYREQSQSHPLQFSKPSGVYADKITQWFEKEPANREEVAIADVLHKLADRQLVKK